jgi:hypothetical protein
VIDVFLCGGLIDFYPSRQFGIVFLQLAAPVVGMIAAYCAGFYIMQPHLKLSVYLAVYFLVFYGTNKILKNLTQQYYLDKILTFLRKGAR